MSFQVALALARQFVGATAPNPPVGAVAIDRWGNILSVQAHERAGSAHAEAKVLADLAQRGLIDQIDSLFITLEPCNHLGRTPPCTEAILTAKVKHVIYGAPDPNPRVAGQGAERLRAAGVRVQLCADPDLRASCEELIRPFSHWATTGLPWVVVKTAHLASGSMIPPSGLKTFTSASSLKLAHQLRKRADAIITGSGTILADRPEFTVRHVPDHLIVTSGAKPRVLVVMDRSGKTPSDWIDAARDRGFEVLIRQDLEETLVELGKRGVLEVLVEAGPTLSAAVVSSSLWNQHVLITQQNPEAHTEASQDRIEIKTNVHWHHPESRNS